jgi:hypothetical protein
VIAVEVDKILEGLSQEERLELLERLVKEGAQTEENLSLEERVKRLEDFVFVGRRGFGPHHAFRHRFFRGPGRGRGCDRWYDYQ